MNLIHSVNLAIRFLLELCILVIFGYWGFKTGQTGLNKKCCWVIGSPILFAIVWVLLAPKSAMRLHGPWLFLLEIAVFGLAVWALARTGRVNLAVAFGVIYLLNKILMLIWRQ
ncbi:MAG: YrdB family protein [Chloroflexi bacterium]|nr:YrdB family protein [Chloroflexota bacterium]